MADANEQARLIENIARVATVSETKSNEGVSLARVKIDERVTDFIPVMQFANSFKQSFVPIRVGEQVLVIQPFGNGDFGIILRGIFSKKQKEPDGANNSIEVTTYEDGTRISYDTEKKLLDINLAKDVVININGHANISIGGDANIEVGKETTVTCSQSTFSGNVTVGSLIVGGASGSKVTSTGGTLTIDDSVIFKGNAKVDNDLKVDGNVTDNRGDLTNHTNNGMERD